MSIVTIYEYIWAEWEGQACRHPDAEGKRIFRACAQQLREAHRLDAIGAEEWRSRYERLIARVDNQTPALITDTELITYLTDLRSELVSIHRRGLIIESLLIASEDEQARRGLEHDPQEKGN